MELKATEETDLQLPSEVHSLSELGEQYQILVLFFFLILYDSIYMNFKNR